MTGEQMLEKAKALALQKHEGQGYGGKPYSFHLERVAEILTEYGFTAPEQLVVGWLHDIVEDTDVTCVALEVEFDLELARAVAWLSDDYGKTRWEKKWRTLIAKREDIDYELRTGVDVFPGYLKRAIRAKVADRLCHFRSMLEGLGTHLLPMYLREALSFRLAYHTKGICDEMWVEYDKLVAEAKASLRVRGDER